MVVNGLVVILTNSFAYVDSYKKAIFLYVFAFARMTFDETRKRKKNR